MGPLLFSHSAYAGKGGGGKGKRNDTVPSQFNFVDQENVALSSLINTNSIIISGINAAASIGISGGEYAVNGGSFVTSASTVNNNDSVQVRQISSSNYLTANNATLNVGGVSDTFTVTTMADPAPVIDTTPDTYSFVDQVNVSVSSVITSNSITIAGINAAAPISISGGEYAVNGGPFTASKSTVNNADSVQVRQTSSATYLAESNAVLNVGGVSDTFTVTTISAPVQDTVPDAFNFTDQVDVPVNSTIVSNSITVTGINAPSSISISGGQYSINGGSFSSTSATVNNNDKLSVQLLSSEAEATLTNATVNIGGVADTFSVLTVDASVISAGPKGDPAFTSEHFSGSANCQTCHDGLTDDAGNDVSIIKAWKSTMMANATRDPLWKAKVRTELNRTPSLAGVINDKCSKCHAPMAHFEAKKDNAPIEILDNGFTNADNAYHDRAMEGVSCTLCHQIKDSPALGTLDGMSGHYEVDSYANAVDRKIYGPYDNLFANPMRMNANYTPEYSAHTKESELCATCHNLKTPFTDDEGNILSSTPESEFPEQMPYSEWLASDYADTQSCQQCHMARSNGVPISNRPMWLEARNDFAQHVFVGGNKFMLDMLSNNKEELGVLATDFSKIITATENLMAGAANIELLNSSQTAGTLGFSVRINSTTGHKLPSAYPSRRAILHVTVKDSLGGVVFESGKVNADGSVTGVDSDANQALYEPHYDTITAADQVQVYEAIMQDYKGDVTYTLLRGSQYVKDNRLLPTGFNKQTVPNDVRVAGQAFDDANFIGGSDDVRYELSGLTEDNYSVSVELVYQTLAYGFAQDLFKDTAKEVTDFKRLYNASNAKSMLVTEKSFIVAP